jgi:hypothetical protein
MAQRRMFSQKIVGSDAFIEMPVSARELYFQLGMYSDDDGFINPKKIIRMVNASEDDLKVLIAKRFVLPFENGVVVIKHWQINNLIRKDFYQPTIYIEQKKQLKIKENKSYTECQQIVNNLSPQVSIGKVSIGKDSIVLSPTGDEVKPRKDQEIFDLINLFKTVNPSYEKLFGNTTQRRSLENLLKKFPFDKLSQIISLLEKTNETPYAPRITTPLQLEDKLGSLIAFLKTEENKTNKITDISNL